MKQDRNARQLLNKLDAIAQGHHQLTANELAKFIADKMVIGDYIMSGRHFKYVTFFDKSGTMEGRNDAGAHHFGEWRVNPQSGTLTVKWDYGWQDNTAFAFEVGEKLEFFDVSTGLWRTRFEEYVEAQN